MNRSFDGVPFYSAIGLPKCMVVYTCGISARYGINSLLIGSNNYWSATTNTNNSNNAWIVNFNNGNVNNNNKNNNNYVRCVRAG